MSIFSKKHDFGIATACLIAIIFSFSTPFVMEANAVGNTVQVATDFDRNTTMQRVKSYVLDGLVWAAAKAMVQQITADTVQWINSGFQGQPAFLTNPEGFALNVADQTTGAFISKTGLLSNLCSPFSVDVRLAIALDMAGYNQNQPYTCTLSSVINNVANSSVNGYSINGFLNGDFNQGGWQGFIAAGNPSNNPGRVYLQAQSDLFQKIGMKQDKVQQQLLQGNGFLSWQDCKSVSAAQVNNTAAGTAEVGSMLYSGTSGTGFLSSGGPTLPGQQNKIPNQNTLASQGITTTPDGSYQSCETKTPGSVISGQLSKQLGSGVDQLNLAQSINQIISALMSQLVTQILHKGFSAASQKPSGLTQSYINELSAQANSPTTYAQSGQSVQGTFTPYINTAQNTASVYGNIVNNFNSTQSSLSAAATCLQNLATQIASTTNSNSSNGNNGNNGSNGALLGEVQRTLATVNQTILEITPIQADYQSKYNTASSSVTTYLQMASDAGNIPNASGLQASGQLLTNFVSTQVPIIQQNSQVADADNTTASAQLLTYNGKAAQYMNQCRIDGGN